jgi:ribonuclease P protein component
MDGGETLRSTDRIRRRSEFRSIQSQGQRVHTRHFIVLLQPNPGRGRRLGITVTKKVSTRAVDRNRIKRLVREVYRRNRKRFPTDCDIVFIAKRGAQGLSYDDVLAEVRGVERSMGRALRSATTQPRGSA